jgi:hypothetical protein
MLAANEQSATETCASIPLWCGTNISSREDVAVKAA